MCRTEDDSPPAALVVVEHGRPNLAVESRPLRLSRLFRRLFLKYLEKAFDAGRLQFFGSLEKLAESHQFRSYLAPLKQTEWVVYAKRPFAGGCPNYVV